MTRSAVFVGDGGSVFVTRTRDALRARGVNIQVVDMSSIKLGSSGNRATRIFRRIRFVQQKIAKLDSGATAFVHYLSPDAVWLIPILKRRFKRVVGIAYGSDILRRNRARDWMLAFGFRRLDTILATNDNVLSAAIKGFPFLAEKQPAILRFGLPVFDALDDLGACTPEEARQRMGFPRDATLVALGYSASPGQRQQELVAHMATIAQDFPLFHFVVPVQYGSPAVGAAIKEQVKTINATLGAARFTALSDFHDPDTAAVMRRATSVLINHSISDAFSGTVQEVIYSGGAVLAQSNLPYASMPGFGSAIKLYDDLNDLTAHLAPSALAAQRTAASKAHADTCAALRLTSSWDGVFKGWCDAIDGPENT